MLRPLTYISGFLGKAQYVVPSDIKLTVACRVNQASVSRTSRHAREVVSLSKPVRRPIELCIYRLWSVEETLKVMYLGSGV